MSGDTFERKVFRVSRLAEFASIAELVKQTGQPVANWPLVIVKELVDNALDAADPYARGTHLTEKRETEITGPESRLSWRKGELR